MGLTTIEVRVEEARGSAPGLRELTLASTTGKPLPTFSPGSHVIVHVPGEARIRNAYSLASPPWQTASYRIVVRRDANGRGGSRWLHDDVAVGDPLAIEHPRNLFVLPSLARHLLLVAGGVGITPFVSWAHQLHADGRSFDLIYAGREKDCPKIFEELRDLAPDSIRSFPDRAGLMASVRESLGHQPLGSHLAVCGPSPMMSAVIEAAEADGWPAERLHLERFAAETGAMEPFRVVLGRDGRQLDVPADQTLLEALEEAELQVPYQCRQGVCGECLTGVLEGTPDHRDVFLTDEEREDGDRIMPCVSRCKAGDTLVLDMP